MNEVKTQSIDVDKLARKVVKELEFSNLDKIARVDSWDFKQLTEAFLRLAPSDLGQEFLDKAPDSKLAVAFLIVDDALKGARYTGKVASEAVRLLKEVVHYKEFS